MKRILKFKRFDYGAQRLIISTAFILGLVFNLIPEYKPFFLLLYFVVGMWQSISFIIHWRRVGKLNFQRRCYLATLIVLLLCCLPPISILGLIFLLYLSPFLALWYLTFTYLEFKKYRREINFYHQHSLV